MLYSAKRTEIPYSSQNREDSNYIAAIAAAAVQCAKYLRTKITMKWWRRKRDSPSSTSKKVLTAVERVEQAQQALDDGQASWAGSFCSYLVDRVTAETVLRAEEKNDNLKKPDKPNPLLKDALTNANGMIWNKQRPLIQRAMGQRVARQIAARTAQQAALSFLEAAKADKEATIDARQFGLHVAVETMAVVVFSNNFADQVKPHLTDLYLPNLASNAKNSIPSSRAAFATVVTNILSEIKFRSVDDDDDVNSCLAMLLLTTETPRTPMEGNNEESAGLTRDEVASNCHSALSAGIQTIATALTGAMAHLAEYSHTYDHDDQTNMSAKALCQETLRILPPVASLPRCPVHRDVEVENLSSLGPTTIIHKNEMFLMDLLSFAHTQQQAKDSVWKFCPGRGKTNAAPFGLGERRCPAGSLSVDAIAAVLESLMTLYDWKLTNPHSDSVGGDGKGGWVSRASYQPTLVYPDSIMLSIGNKKGGSI